MRHTGITANPILAALFLAAAFFLAATLPIGAENPDFHALLVDLLDGYQRIMVADAANDPADEPGAAWESVADAVRRDILRFTIDPMNEGLVDGARFFASPEEDFARIYLSIPLLETAPERPAAAYAVLMGAVAEAAVFFENPEAWWNALGDALDRLRIERTCRRLQAEMIRNRLVPMGLDPGSFGTFLLDSLESDGLAGAMLYLDGVSLPTAARLEGLRAEFRGSGDPEALREGILAFGEELIAAREDLPKDADDLIFPAAVSVHTWLELTPGLIAEAHGGSSAAVRGDFPEILESEPEYGALRMRLETSRIGDMPLIFHVMGNVKAGFEIY